MTMNRLSGSAVEGADAAGRRATLVHPAGPASRYAERSDRPLPAARDLLDASIDATYRVAMAKLGQVEPTPRYKAVARLSGHLAAMHRAVYSVAGQLLGKNEELLTVCQAEARQAEWALRLFECHLAGDASAADRDMQAVHAWLGWCLDAYRAAERELIAQVQERLTARESEQLAHGYRVALGCAPTRPHPRSPHGGWPGWIFFRVHAFWDGVLDTVDSRPGVGRA